MVNSRRFKPASFTLVEMVATIIVMLILMVLASFGARQLIVSSRQVSAISNIERVAVQESKHSEASGSYTIDPEELLDAGSDLNLLVNGEISQAPEDISLASGSFGSIGLAADNGSGECIWYYLPALDSGDPPIEVERPDSAPCKGSESLDVANGEEVQNG